jgi:LysR family transcriptional regulator, benzoate and cis,cis-muconate-responsive activator of ben and cat genes
MELRQLRAFVEIAAAGSITAAAKVLRLTQPALSRQIKALEEELDVSLLIRGAHSINLTPAGELLKNESIKLLRFSDTMIEKVRAEAAGEPLRVAYAPSLAAEFIASAIERFSQIHSRVRVSLFDRSSAEMHAGLAAGKFDLILAVPCAGDAVRWMPLRDYGWEILLPANHPLASKQIISPADLDGQKLLLLERESYPDYWHRVTKYFKDRNLQAKIAGEFDGRESLSSAVEAGMGIALVAQAARKGAWGRDRSVLRRLSDEPTRIVVAAGTAADRDCSAWVLAFIEELKRAAAEC